MKETTAHEKRLRRACRRLKPHGLRFRRKQAQQSAGTSESEKSSHES